MSVDLLHEIDVLNRRIDGIASLATARKREPPPDNWRLQQLEQRVGYIEEHWSDRDDPSSILALLNDLSDRIDDLERRVISTSAWLRRVQRGQHAIFVLFGLGGQEQSLALDPYTVALRFLESRKKRRRSMGEKLEPPPHG
jgi:hypothetical protein